MAANHWTRPSSRKVPFPTWHGARTLCVHRVCRPEFSPTATIVYGPGSRSAVFGTKSRDQARSGALVANLFPQTKLSEAGGRNSKSGHTVMVVLLMGG